jgi:hypothetical protein
MEIIKFRRATKNWARLQLKGKKQNKKNRARKKEERERTKEVRRNKSCNNKTENNPKVL